ncbi:MAG TPA: DUF2807 domain-containing protein [Sphingobacteriaceae bacterium]
MKTTIGILSKSLIMVLALIIFTGSRKPAKAGDIRTVRTTILADIRDLSRIEVSGNVELLLSQGEKEQVEVYDQAESRGRKIRFNEGTLQIRSAEKLTVLVTVSNLQSLEASGQAVIRSLNRISSIDLDVRLRDQARGMLEAEALNLTATLEGTSRMDLSGQAENQVIALSEGSRLQAAAFRARNRSLTISDSALASFGNTEIRTPLVSERFARTL